MGLLYLFTFTSKCKVSFKPFLQVLAQVDLILLLLFQHTVHNFGGSLTYSSCLSQYMLIASWIAIVFKNMFLHSACVFICFFSFLDGCPKNLAPLTEVTPLFNVETHLETFVLPTYLLSKSYFQHSKVCMLFPSFFKSTIF